MPLHDDRNPTSHPPGASVSGTIEFQDVREPTHNVTVYVRVQDTSRTDANASTVAQLVIRAVNIAPGGRPLPFTVKDIPENPAARYTLRVHADVNGDGVVSRGDYVSMQSYHVQNSGSTVLTILARRVQ